MAYEVVVAAEAERDLDLIFDHLFASYCGFGDDPGDAFRLATRRVGYIRAALDGLGAAPHRGTRHDALLPGLRHVTVDQAIFWFTLDEKDKELRVLAIFFGGQDHVRHMVARLLSDRR